MKDVKVAKTLLKKGETMKEMTLSTVIPESIVGYLETERNYLMEINKEFPSFSSQTTTGKRRISKYRLKSTPPMHSGFASNAERTASMYKHSNSSDLVLFI